MSAKNDLSGEITFGMPVDHIVPDGGAPVTCVSHSPIVAFKATTVLQAMGICCSYVILDSYDTKSHARGRSYCPVRYMDAAMYHTGTDYADMLSVHHVPPELAHEAVVPVTVHGGNKPKDHPQCVRSDSETTMAMGIIVPLCPHNKRKTRRDVSIVTSYSFLVSRDVMQNEGHYGLQRLLNQLMSGMDEFHRVPSRNPDNHAFTHELGKSVPVK